MASYNVHVYMWSEQVLAGLPLLACLVHSTVVWRNGSELSFTFGMLVCNFCNYKAI